MLVLCSANAIIEQDGRGLGHPNATVVMEHDSNRDHRDIAIYP